MTETGGNQGAGRRALLVTVDQAVSSASNVAILIYAAHIGGPLDFGRFTIVLLLATLAQGLVRSLVSLPLLIHPEDADTRPRAPIVAAAWVGVAAAAPVVAVGGLLTWTGAALGPALVALGVCLPLLQVQDLGRYLGIAQGRPVRAITLDAVWIVLMVATFAAAHVLHREIGLTFLIIGWAGPGAAAALLVLAQHGVPRRAELGLGWLRERWTFSWRTLVGNLAGNGGAVVAAILMSYVSSALAVAAVRSAILLGRLGAAVQLAVGSSAAADIARANPDDHDLLRHQRRSMTLAGAAAGANIAVLLLLPDAVGRLILGDVWGLMKPLLLPTGLAVVALAAQSGVKAALLGRREVGTAMITDVAGAIITVVVLVVGAAMGGASGAVWALVIGQSLSSLLWWIVFVEYLRQRRRGVGRHRAGR